jgi:hypothetical protein
MKIKNVEFSGNLKDNIENELKIYKPLLLKIINNGNLYFDNYKDDSGGTCIIPVKNKSYRAFSSSYYIFWNKETGDSLNKYIRIDLDKGISLGFQSNSGSYLDLFIGEDYYDNLEDVELIEGDILKWTNGMESFITSQFVKKHKTLLKYLHWAGNEKCLPNYLFIDFSLKGIADKNSIIIKFANTEYVLKDLKQFIKILEKRRT